MKSLFICAILRAGLFVVHTLNAVSHLGAAWLASRVGLVNPKVFTHLPSSLLLIAVRQIGGPAVLRQGKPLVEIEVPTRQSYWLRWLPQRTELCQQ